MGERSRYPAISLAEAVARLERIHEQEGSGTMSSEAAVQHMGYSSLNGASMSVLAALKKYGLLEGRGDDIRISQHGLVIISDKLSQEPAERAIRADALQTALTSDPLFRELQDRFKGRTTEINVASYLQKKGFKPAAARNAAKSYIESSAFVEKEGGGYTSTPPIEADAQPVESRILPREVGTLSMPTQSYENKGEFIEAPLVISGVERWPVIRLPKKFTDKNWADMIAMLTAMKPGLVTNTSSESTPDERQVSGDSSGKSS